MTNKPIKPLQQSTPEVQNKQPNIKDLSTYFINSTTIINPNNIVEEEVYLKDSGDVAAIAVTLAPADYVTVDPSRFYTFQETASAVDVPKITLPQGFTVSLDPSTESPGKYGTIVTASDGTQTVTATVQIPDVDGIINYEVRLIKND